MSRSVGLLLLWWLIALCWVAASIDTKQNGFFTQRRVGRYARAFTVVKLRTMRAGGRRDHDSHHCARSAHHVDRVVLEAKQA